MANLSLRTASLGCLGIWAAIWLLFLLMRFSPQDIRVIPGIGPFLLIALLAAFLAPLAAAALACAAICRQPRAPANWLTLAAAIAVTLGQASLFLASRWM